MYRGFNLVDIDDCKFPVGSKETGEEMHSKYKAQIKTAFDDFVTPGGALNASKMQKNWFPNINADIFISHSHRDQEKAISLAGWLKNVFKINAFVDSCAWGFSDDLLRLVDNKFCWSEKSGFYIYENRNRSTSHVHMMLSTALMMMIDQAECIFFLNTPSSLLPSDTIGDSVGTTASPWIYSEVAMTKFLRKRSKGAHRGIIKEAMLKAEMERSMVFLYDMDMGHLSDLTIDSLNKWYSSRSTYETAWDALDGLYAL